MPKSRAQILRELKETKQVVADLRADIEAREREIERVNENSLAGYVIFDKAHKAQIEHAALQLRAASEALRRHEGEAWLAHHLSLEADKLSPLPDPTNAEPAS